ncbi:hypothetical protein [Ferrimonas balearica]|uniref:hypothetical protein n=1 Tax=Ferrimonas balearica TaxID=44012 RepID=UPI001C98FC10|nr:hypothetical protein [Ferrimonas balearica]MBY5923316.1 hypothetical protein [Ferrimonas balearica]MBY5995274.1 hypothetical protein [Ferrimonas balearica]
MMRWLCGLILALSAATLSAGERPYHPDSPWNLKIGETPKTDPNSAFYLSQMSGVFGIDPNQYTMPVYEIDASTPMKPVLLSGVFSEVSNQGQDLRLLKRTTVLAPLPVGARAAKGSDSQIVLWDPVTGDEWGFWQARPLPDGSWVAVNGYRYNTRWSGVPPRGFISRGAGVPYLIGLVRPWEIQQGRIDHAIALGINYPNPMHIHPATKSDGKAFEPHYLPMGARLQLDPTLGEADFDRWQLTPVERVIARALQQYGMILIDGSGHPKLYAEYEGTAHWDGALHKRTLRRIPYEAFRVLDLTTQTPQQAPAATVVVREGARWLEWPEVPGANRYRIWLDGEPQEVRAGPLQIPATSQEIRLAALNHQGLGPAITVVLP